MTARSELRKTYLGDSVYVEEEGETRMIKLYTNNGFGPSNIIYLEPEVWEALVRWKEESNVVRLRG